MSPHPLITVQRSKIPEYLHPSEFYLSLSPDEEEDEFLVPANCMKQDLIVRDIADLDNLLLTMRFWILESFPNEVIEIITRSRNAVKVVELLLKFETAFPGVRGLIKYIFKMGIEKACHLSAKFGRVDFLNFFAKEQNLLDMKTLRIAVKNGHKPCLSYCYDYLRTRGSVDLVGTDWRKVIENGNFECLPFLVGKGVTVSQFLSLALQLNNAKCLKYLHTKFHANCWGPSTMKEAVRKGKLKLVQGLHELGCEWDESAYIAAICADKDECFEYLIKQRGLPKSVTFANIVPRLKCRLVLCSHKIEEVNLKHLMEMEKLEKRLQQLDSKIERLAPAVKKASIVVHPSRWK